MRLRAQCARRLNLSFTYYLRSGHRTACDCTPLDTIVCVRTRIRHRERNEWCPMLFFHNCPGTKWSFNPMVFLEGSLTRVSDLRNRRLLHRLKDDFFHAMTNSVNDQVLSCLYICTSVHRLYCIYCRWCIARIISNCNSAYPCWLQLIGVQGFIGVSGRWPVMKPRTAYHAQDYHESPSRSHCIGYSWVRQGE